MREIKERLDRNVDEIIWNVAEFIVMVVDKVNDRIHTKYPRPEYTDAPLYPPHSDDNEQNNP